MRRGDVEIELRQRGGQFVKEPRPIKPGDFDDRVAVRPLIVDGNFRLDGERLEPAFRRRALGDDVRQFQLATHRFLDGIADPRRAARFILVTFEFA